MIRLGTIRFGALLALLATLVLLASLTVSAQAAGEWTATGATVYGPMFHPAALLADGRVLVPGGNTVSGGVVSCSLSYTQFFDPATNNWTAASNMGTARSLHTATTLNDGRVLVVSGSTAELFDPATGSWTVTDDLTTSRSRHTATRLNDGRVLIAGGFNLSSAELFDPATNTWTVTGSLGTFRWDHTAALLNDGLVLVAGGRADEGGNFVPLGSTEIFDPATGTWTASGSLGTPRSSHTATRLSDGRVLAAGGLTNGASLSSAEIYDPASGTWAATSSMINDRRNYPATQLNDGRVLVVGGDGSGSCCAELFDSLAPPPTPTPTPTPTPSITVIVPNGDEVWQIGSTQAIQWNSEGVTGNVKIQLSRDGGGSYKPIANNVPNTGTFQWTITKPATTQALIRVISINQSSVQDTSDSVFSIIR